MLDRLAIHSNEKAVARIIRGLPKRYMEPAARQAVNNTLRNARVEYSKRVRKRVAVKASTVKNSMNVTKAPRGALEASISWGFKPLSLKAFGSPRQKRKGTAVTVLKGQRQTIKGAFISEAMGGHVYLRYGEKRRPTKGRYLREYKNDGSPILRQPVKKLFGPSMLSQARIILPGMKVWASDRMEENTRQAANRYLARIKRRSASQ